MKITLILIILLNFGTNLGLIDGTGLKVSFGKIIRLSSVKIAETLFYYTPQYFTIGLILLK